MAGIATLAAEAAAEHEPPRFHAEAAAAREAAAEAPPPGAGDVRLERYNAASQLWHTLAVPAAPPAAAGRPHRRRAQARPAQKGQGRRGPVADGLMTRGARARRLPGRQNPKSHLVVVNSKTHSKTQKRSFPVTKPRNAVPGTKPRKIGH